MAKYHILLKYLAKKNSFSQVIPRISYMYIIFTYDYFTLFDEKNNEDKKSQR